MFLSYLLFTSALIAGSFSTADAAVHAEVQKQGRRQNVNHHTYILTPQTEPASSFAAPELSYQTAAVCFLGFGDCGGSQAFASGDSTYELNPEDMCREEGFSLTSCALPSYPDGICSYSSSFFKACTVDKPRACKDAGYLSSCNEGFIQDPSQPCPYDSSFYKCRENPCDGYDCSYEEATAEGYVIEDFCLSGTSSKYKRKENPCTGFLTCDCGGEIGTETCVSGTTTKYAVCKQCYIPCASGLIDIDNYWCGSAMKCWLK